jgi:7-cyano-7-deazaguanine synthase
VTGSDSALVLFSGGQDSTTCLFWSINRFREVYALSIDYGQRHALELDSARTIAKMAGVSHQVLKFDFFSAVGETALTGSKSVSDLDLTPGSESANEGLPSTFVPGRNLIFITLAAAIAYEKGMKHLVTGVCQTDYSGYPDCRDDTMKALQVALNLGMESAFVLHTPLMWLTKRETVLMAQAEGAMQALAHSHTCYRGVSPPCGQCAACILRAKGFKEANLKDPLLPSL